MIQLQVTGKTIETLPLLGMFQQGESGAETVEIRLPKQCGETDLSGLRFILYGIADGDVAATALLDQRTEGDEVFAIWRVTADFTTGRPLSLKLIGMDAEQNQAVKFSGRYPILSNEDGSVSAVPSSMGAFQDALFQMGRILEESKRVSSAVPYIGENGRWYVWDQALGKYQDSGKASQGERGESPTISVRRDTGEEYVLSIDGPEGSFSTPNLIGGIKRSEADTVYANVLRGKAVGEGLTLTDCLPLPLDGLIVEGRTTETRAEPDTEKSPLNPSVLTGAENPNCFLSGKNVYFPAAAFPVLAGNITVGWDEKQGELVLNGTPGAEGSSVALGKIPFLWEPGQSYSLTLERAGGELAGSGSTCYVGAVAADGNPGGFSLEAGFSAVKNQKRVSTTLTYSGSEGDQAALSLWVGPGVTGMTNLRLRVQLEKGGATEFTPAQRPQLAEAQTGPLHRLPDGTCDWADLKRGRVTRWVKSVTLNGSESWGLYEDQEGAAVSHQSFKLSIPDCVGAASYQTSNLICSDLPLKDGDTLWASDISGVWYAEAWKLLIVKVPKAVIPGWKDNVSKTERASLFQQWLASHPITVLMQRREALEEDCPPLQLSCCAGETRLQAGPGLHLYAEYRQDSNLVIQQLRDELNRLSQGNGLN